MLHALQLKNKNLVKINLFSMGILKAIETPKLRRGIISIIKQRAWSLNEVVSQGSQRWPLRSYWFLSN